MQHVATGALTWTQEMIFHLQKQSACASALVIHHLALLDGPLDYAAFETAFRHQVSRHEPLHSRYVQVKGIPRVEVMANSMPRFECRDLRSHSRKLHPSLLAEIVMSATAEEFNLEQGELIRCLLVRLSEQRCALLLSVHHICCDGWSLAVMGRELSTNYRLLLLGKRLGASSPITRCSDYAARQRAWLAGPSAEKQLEWWRAKFSHISFPYVSLAKAVPRSTRHDPETESVRSRQVVRLSLEALTRLRATAARHRVSVFILLLAAFNMFLLRRKRRSQLTVGTLMANRMSKESIGLMGAHYNPVVLATDFGTSRLSPSAALDIISRSFFEAFRHQELPFALIAAMLMREFGIIPAALLPLLMVVDKHPLYELQLAHVSLWELELSTASPVSTARSQVLRQLGTTGSDLALVGWESDGGCTLLVDFDATRIPVDSVGLFVESYLDIVTEFLETLGDGKQGSGSLISSESDNRGLIRRASYESARR